MINTRLSWVVSKCAGKLRRMAGLSGGGEGGLDLYPRWDVLLGKDAARWRAARTAAESGPRVLIATSIGGHAPLLTVESLLAVALTLRGARVHLLLCDESLPACMNASYIQFPDVDEFVRDGPTYLCAECYGPGRGVFESLGLPFHRFGDHLSPEDRSEAQRLSNQINYEAISGYCDDGIAVGEHALAGALRFLGRGDLENEPRAEPIVRRYLRAALLTTAMARRLFRAHDFEASCFHHGIYVPQGLIGEAARREGVRVVNWNAAYRKQCFIFSHGDTYHHTLLDEPVSHWEELPWSTLMEAEIMDYLKSRWRGTRDWIWFHERPREELDSIAAEIGVDFSKPCIGLLTNVMWDAQLHYRANAFPNMLEWTLQTIRYFASRPELQLLIRVHPAEVRSWIPARQSILSEIHREFPSLPPNVFVIGPRSQVSTYAAMAECNAVLIYGTKTGVELTSMGIPVIVGGEAWIRNKGITDDASTPEEYFRMLDQLPLPGRMDDEQTRRARKYAYHFFFRRMIPLRFMEPLGDLRLFYMQLRSLDELMPGRELGLDVICDGILRGDPFIYPVETLHRSDDGPVDLPNRGSAERPLHSRAQPTQT